jgi:hypothetical protein
MFVGVEADNRGDKNHPQKLIFETPRHVAASFGPVFEATVQPYDDASHW